MQGKDNENGFAELKRTLNTAETQVIHKKDRKKSPLWKQVGSYSQGFREMETLLYQGLDLGTNRRPVPDGLRVWVGSNDTRVQQCINLLVGPSYTTYIDFINCIHICASLPDVKGISRLQ